MQALCRARCGPRSGPAPARGSQPRCLAVRATAAQQVAQAGGGAPAEHAALDDAYNSQMARQMGWSSPFEYHFDRGLYFHEVAPRLFCGTQPRNPDELRQLAGAHRVDVIVNLQQDKDMEYWGIDWGANCAAMRELGLELVRHPAVDFDPHSLRKMLPGAVKEVAARLREGKRVYVHCTAGLGRAPAVCIAWLYWYGPHLSLDGAYGALTSIRPCGPKRDAIRGATFDVLDDRPFEAFDHLPQDAWAGLNEQDKARLQERIQAHWG
ncbi:LSF2 [Scenedesmus sp. PABB004]|nr:LSF2 [Scenedesmus sp. PABB004]